MLLLQLESRRAEREKEVGLVLVVVFGNPLCIVRAIPSVCVENAAEMQSTESSGIIDNSNEL